MVHDFSMVLIVTLGQLYHIGEKPTVIQYTFINGHAGTTPFTVFKQNLTASRPSEHSPVRGENVSSALWPITGRYS